MSASLPRPLTTATAPASGRTPPGPAGGPYGGEPGSGETPGLAEEVERALARVLGRAGRTAGIG